MRASGEHCILHPVFGSCILLAVIESGQVLTWPSRERHIVDISEALSSNVSNSSDCGGRFSSQVVYYKTKKGSHFSKDFFFCKVPKPEWGVIWYILQLLFKNVYIIFTFFETCF